MGQQERALKTHGINVIGHFQKALGLGETSRLYVNSLTANNIPFSLISADSLAPFHSNEAFHLPISNEFKYPINLFCLAPDNISHFIEKTKWKHFKKSYNIGVWYWETNIIPKKIQTSWKYLDEIWVASRYVQEHLSIATALPVHRITQPIHLPNMQKPSDKQQFGLKDKFTFLFCFNFFSIVNRKNPLALIHSFQKAFPKSQDVQLVIKSQGGDQHLTQLKPFQELIKNDSRIHWIDRSLDGGSLYDLMNACDCYVSLHRSEGFGITMAEMMLLGKPVIATGFSGNLDFMNEENSFLCSHILKPIGKGNSPYPANGLWADVDVNQAAFWMKYVFENPEIALAKAQKGKDFILKHHSYEVVGDQIKKRLLKILLPQKRKFAPWQYRKNRTIRPLMRLLKPCLKFLKNSLLNSFKKKKSL